MNPWELLEKASNRAHFQAESVGICLGHMTNAITDLQSGETRATAIATLQRGIALIDKRNEPMRELAQSIKTEREIRAAIEFAQRIEAGTDETRNAAQPEGREPGSRSECAHPQSGTPYND